MQTKAIHAVFDAKNWVLVLLESAHLEVPGDVVGGNLQ